MAEKMSDHILPVMAVMSDLLASLRASSNAVLIAPPGAGKTTMVASALLDEPYCDGQILVLYDLLGLFDDFVPKFVRPYAHLKTDALQALRRFKEEVEQGKFPSDAESYR